MLKISGRKIMRFPKKSLACASADLEKLLQRMPHHEKRSRRMAHRHKEEAPSRGSSRPMATSEGRQGIKKGFVRRGETIFPGRKGGRYQSREAAGKKEKGR